MKKRFFVLFVVAMFILVACAGGCTAKPEETAPVVDSEVAPTEEAVAEKRSDINVCLVASIPTIDPQEASFAQGFAVRQQIYDSLTYQTLAGEVGLRLAESYTLSEDGRVYTFKLHEGVLFHNGEELKASDVVFTFERAKDHDALYSVTKLIESVTAIDDYTVEFKLYEPNSPFLSAIATDYYGILNEKFVTEEAPEGRLDEIACGTGPYKLVSFNSETEIVLEAFKEYYRGEPSIDKVTFKIITDHQTAVVALETGDLDFMNIPATSYAAFSDNAEFTAGIKDMGEVSFIALNAESGPLADPKVRQALAYALDREGAVIAVNEGLGAPAYCLINHDLIPLAPTEFEKYEYNPEKAKALLAEAGYADGLDVGVLKTSATYTLFTKLAQFYQQNLSAIGVNMELELMEGNTLVADGRNQNFDLFILSEELTGDPDMLNMMLASTGAANYAGYADAEVDELFAQGARESGDAERAAIYQKIVDLTQEDMVYIPATYNLVPYAYDKDLTIDAMTKYFFNIYDAHWN